MQTRRPTQVRLKPDPTITVDCRLSTVDCGAMLPSPVRIHHANSDRGSPCVTCRAAASCPDAERPVSDADSGCGGRRRSPSASATSRPCPTSTARRRGRCCHRRSWHPRLFVNDMRGPISSVSYDGRTVMQYIDINAATWGVGVQSAGRERGMQSFAFHPQFGQRGARIWEVLHADRRHEYERGPDFRPAVAPTRTTRSSSSGRPRNGGGQVRWRRTPRVDAPGTALCEPQRRSARVQPERETRQPRGGLLYLGSPMEEAAAIR